MDETDSTAALQALEPLLDGELLTDDMHRMLYATDASVYQELPLGVVYPRHRADLVALVRHAGTHGIPLIPRAAGTSLAGQCVGAGLVVDVSRHMTSILEIDAGRRRVRVQPGVILDDLNDALRPHGLMFGPETSTSNRCMIGGMIGNNAAGSHSIVHGTTRDHVLAIDAVLADGSEVTFGAVDEAALRDRKQRDTREGAIYRELAEIVDGHRALILERSPKREVLRRNNGYPLDRLAAMRPWDDEADEPFNVAPLLCGSEGTLALIAEATLNLIPLPRNNLVVACHFATLDEGTRGTVMALEHGPSAVELMDGTILELSKHNPEALRNRWWVEGEPGAVLAVEFYDDDPGRLRTRAEGMIAAFCDAGMGFAFPIVESSVVPQVWAVRKAGLGLLTGVRGDRKPLTIIEDVAVAPADLPEYVRRMQALMEQHGTDAVYYGHASVGELHVRPALSLRDEADLETFRQLGRQVAELAAEFGASLAGEHGVGRLRGVYLESFLGAEMYTLLRRVKRVFDPDHLLNPGKIVDAPPNDEQLRMSPDRPVVEVETHFDWSADEGLLRAAEKCNGAGVCRKSAGRGTMCPSYMATGDELHSTRGRANLFRHILTSEDPATALASSDELKEALELCLSCKGCKGECPSNVDIARMKAEFLQHYYDRHGTPLSATVLGQFGRFAKLARFTPGIASAVSNTAAVKKVLGVDPRREVPAFAAQTFDAWFRRRTPPVADGRPEVVLFADEFTNHTEPDVGVAAVELLEAAGYRVLAPPGLDSGRTHMSKGLVRAGRKVFRHAVEVLLPYAERGLPIVGLEPSAILGFRDEAPDLLADVGLRDAAERVSGQALLLEEFLAREADAGNLDKLQFREDAPRSFTLHGHCHQKALVGTAATERALALIDGAEVEVIPSGCCGMAGSFGYHHYELSMAIGEQVLFPAVRAAADETVVVAPGTSCRHQIHDGTGRTALHPAQVLRDALVDDEVVTPTPADVEPRRAPEGVTLAPGEACVRKA